MTDPAPLPPPPPWRQALPRLAMRLGVLVLCVWAAHWLIDRAMVWSETLPAEAQGEAVRRILLISFALYALLIAIPFVPGIEIALALLMLRGEELALPIYISTLAGLALAYFVGRLVPLPALERLFLDLHLTRPAALLKRLAPLHPRDRVALLKEALPQRFAQGAMRYRYLGLGLLINMPGSGLIGGGGGISMVAGMSGVFTPGYTLLTLSIAILPFPLFVILAGSLGWMPWISH